MLKQLVAGEVYLIESALLTNVVAAFAKIQIRSQANVRHRGATIENDFYVT